MTLTVAYNHGLPNIDQLNKMPETLVTFSSSKTMDVDHDGVLKEVDLRRDVGNELGERLENMCDDAWDFAALLVKHVITVLLNKMEHTSLQIFRLFQELIHELVR